ncbi:hypothetical protein BGZ76_007705 [Entomortierella beljakovae]|nr:hypothetical protein BGZ76_007705 [Entomortierella beljakovae]
MTFWKPGAIAPGSLVDRESEKDSEAVVVSYSNTKYATLSLNDQRKQLPVYNHRRHTSWSDWVRENNS